MRLSTMERIMKSLRDRIEINPRILVGKPVIRGTRIPVYLIVNLLAQGKTAEYILTNYPDLHEMDIRAALQFAAETTNFSEEIIVPT